MILRTSVSRSWQNPRTRLPLGRPFPHSPSCHQQTGRRGRFTFSECPKGCKRHLLTRLRGARNHSARQICRQSLLKPLLRQQTKIAPRHINHPGRIFKRGQRRSIMGLSMMAR